MYEPVELGDRVKDPITSFSGIANCITVWLNGCIRIGVIPEKLDKEGKPQDERYFDQGSLLVVKKKIHKPMTLAVQEVKPETRRSNGGPNREVGNFKR